MGVNGLRRWMPCNRDLTVDFPNLANDDVIVAGTTSLGFIMALQTAPDADRAPQGEEEEEEEEEEEDFA